ncbi:MAG: hypothetical protein JW737_02010 [Acidobacteria bacterium]|nr:hypothetical protein [Acidobacteriota bacterium]
MIKKISLILILILLPVLNLLAQEADRSDKSKDVTLSDSLKVLEPLVGKHWIGKMGNPVDGKVLDTDRNFQVIWDGTVVKYSSSIKQINSYSEGYFYWDNKQNAVTVFIISGKGIVQKGTVTTEDGKIIVKGTITFPERAFDYKNEFEFTADGKMTDRWFHNAFGDWRPGHVVEFTAE